MGSLRRWGEGRVARGAQTVGRGAARPGGRPGLLPSCYPGGAAPGFLPEILLVSSLCVAYVPFV